MVCRIHYLHESMRQHEWRGLYVSTLLCLLPNSEITSPAGVSVTLCIREGLAPKIGPEIKHTAKWLIFLSLAAGSAM